MPRLLFVIACAAVIAVTTLLHEYGIALVTGIVSGAVLFLYGMSRGGAMGNLRTSGKRPQDVSTRIGTALAAAGIGAASLGHIPAYPLSFRIFYGVALVIGCVGAVFLAARNTKPSA